MTMDKKHILFVVALILLVVSIVYLALNPFEQARVDSLTYTGEKRLPDRSETLKENRPTVHTFHDTVSRFIDPLLVSATVHQDLFSIYQPPRLSPAPEASPALSPDDTPIEEPNHRHDLIQEAIKELSEYQIFGIFEDDKRISVFLAKDDRVIIAAKGDRLEDKYRIDEIEKNHIKIMALHLNEPIQLDMREFNNE